MAVNVYKPHLYVIPEDDADRQFADGFELDYRLKPRAMQVMPTAGGWMKVVEKILDDYVPKVRRNRHTHVIGIIDCDEHPKRIEEQLERIPEDVRDRIFLLGTLEDPQAFKRSVNQSFEKIGIDLADECFRKQFELWRHAHFSHLYDEIDRAAGTLHSILFDEQQ